jgi:flagellar protein FlgJ
MTASLNAAFTFTDMQGLGELRREAAADSPDARRAVAQQFEALFLNQMLKQMRDASAVVDGGLVDRDRMRFHEDMLDQQLSLSLSRGRGIGLADSILRQLGGEEGVGRPHSPAGPVTLPGRAQQLLQDATAPTSRVQDSRRAASAGAAAAENFAPETPAAFVAELRPHAQRAARRLGIPAETLIAQAALETGWGRHMIRDGAGAPSFNLFGVKATGGWQGGRANVSTLEFINGVPERRREPFRVYEGIAQSFDDYVKLIESRPRYQAALAAGSSEGYLRGLQAGGYATDPDYADKILAIIERGLPQGRGAAPAQLDQVHSAAADSMATGRAGRPRAAAGDEI